MLHLHDLRAEAESLARTGQVVRGSLLLHARKPCFVMARYLSRADLSRIAGKYIDQYYTRFGISKDAPEPIDPERLASAVLGLNVKMLPLCSDGSVLGLTVFKDAVLP